jgi:K+ transporter
MLALSPSYAIDLCMEYKALAFIVLGSVLGVVLLVLAFKTSDSLAAAVAGPQRPPGLL